MSRSTMPRTASTGRISDALGDLASVGTACRRPAPRSGARVLEAALDDAPRKSGEEHLDGWDGLACE